MSATRRVLIIGEDPDLIDFSDPAIPPGTTAAGIREGLDEALRELRASGREADLLLTQTVATAAEQTRRALEAASYDCVVIGAGLRVVPGMTTMFELIVNVVHEAAPTARLAFNTSPGDSAAAAERQLARRP